LRRISADPLTLKNKILTPDMLKQRKRLFAAMTHTSKKRTLSFKIFLQVLLVLKTKDGTGKKKARELISVMGGLADFQPSRAYLLQTLDKYLVRM
jgi:hypothetical protein